MKERLVGFSGVDLLSFRASTQEDENVLLVEK